MKRVEHVNVKYAQQEGVQLAQAGRDSKVIQLTPVFEYFKQLFMLCICWIYSSESSKK